MPAAFQAEFVEDGILRITFDHPGQRVNLFDPDSLRELEQLADDLAGDPSIRAAFVVSAKKDNFLSGADVNEIQRIATIDDAYLKARAGQKLFQQWSDLPFPTLAVVDGVCVGGGLEWILSFSFRVCSDRHAGRIGFPEVSLGILPGWGGTVRLPRLVGLEPGLKMILGSKLISAQEAYTMGIFDAMIPHEILEHEAIKFLRRVLSKGDSHILKRRKKLPGRRGLGRWGRPGRSLVLRTAARSLGKPEARFYPAPGFALKSVRFALENEIPDALEYEARQFMQLAASEICKNLVSLYFIRESIKKGKGILPGEDGQIGKIQKVAVVGAGTMGRGIAWTIARKGIPVRLKDQAHEALSAALSHARSLFDKEIVRGRMSRADAVEMMDRISPTLAYKGFATVDLAIETVVEDQQAKQNTLEQIDRCTPPETVIASNTSTIPISVLAAACHHPGRVAGLHFMNPVDRIPLVEIIRGKLSSDETIATLYAFAQHIGKLPIVVNDSPGFLLNRVMAPYLNEAQALLEKGVAVDQIDRAMIAFGIPRGPFRLLDEIGFDVALRAYTVLRERLPERYPDTGFLRRLVDDGRLGKKNRLGFYRYTPKKSKREGVDKRIYRLLDVKPKDRRDPIEVEERLIFLMINEAARCLEEGVTSDAATVDAAAVFGMGFPPWRGGLLRYAEQTGLVYVRNRLNAFAAEGADWYQPAKLVDDLANSGGSFYDTPS